MRRPILAKLLIPMAVAMSLRSTMPLAKDCLMGMVDMMTTRRRTRSATARASQGVRVSPTVRPALIQPGGYEGENLTPAIDNGRYEGVGEH